MARPKAVKPVASGILPTTRRDIRRLTVSMLGMDAPRPLTRKKPGETAEANRRKQAALDCVPLAKVSPPDIDLILPMSEANREQVATALDVEHLSEQAFEKLRGICETYLFDRYEELTADRGEDHVTALENLRAALLATISTFERVSSAGGDIIAEVRGAVALALDALEAVSVCDHGHRAFLNAMPATGLGLTDVTSELLRVDALGAEQTDAVPVLAEIASLLRVLQTVATACAEHVQALRQGEADQLKTEGDALDRFVIRLRHWAKEHGLPFPISNAVVTPGQSVSVKLVRTLSLYFPAPYRVAMSDGWLLRRIVDALSNRN